MKMLGNCTSCRKYDFWDERSSQSMTEFPKKFSLFIFSVNHRQIHGTWQISLLVSLYYFYNISRPNLPEEKVKKSLKKSLILALLTFSILLCTLLTYPPFSAAVRFLSDYPFWVHDGWSPRKRDMLFGTRERKFLYGRHNKILQMSKELNRA